MSEKSRKRDTEWPEKAGGAPVKHGLYRKIDMKKIDGRTDLGKTINGLKNEMRAFVNDPSPSTELLIQRITYKAIRLTLYEHRMLTDPQASENEAVAYIPMANSFRADLKTLSELAGKKAEEETPDLKKYIEQTYGTGEP